MTSTKKYHLGVFIGRFSPFHRTHKKTVDLMLDQCENVVILIGSARSAETIRTPFTFKERQTMIMEVFQDHPNRILCLPLRDSLYNDNAWVAEVQGLLLPFIQDTGDRVALFGSKTDSSSYYLDMFPQWEFVDTRQYFTETLHATEIREALYQGNFQAAVLDKVPSEVRHFLDKWVKTDIFEDMSSEYRFIREYKSQWQDAPYAPTFVTVDAVVVKSAHILLITRKHRPGKGLMALPGGFLGQDEDLKTAMVRELKEETGLKVPSQIVQGSIVASRVFDHPKRSERGRTITNAFHVDLGPGKLPEIKGADDADKAFWLSIEMVKNFENCFFEDHFAIIQTMLGI